MSINKVSQAIPNQLPGFIGSEYELFSKFIEYYYKSQEKTGLGQNILNNFLNYLDIDKLDVDILDGKTKLSQLVSATDDVISVESVELFLEENGSILIGDEVIFYEKSQSSPNISLGPGISYDQVKLKWVELQSPLRSFNGVTRSFPLTSQDRPIVPPSANHLIVQVYDEYLIPGVDFTVDSGNIVFTTAPRQVLPADSEELSSINFLSGFVENNIIVLDNISPSFGDGVREFKVTNNSAAYIPDSDEYILAYYDNQLLVPKRDFVFDKDLFIFRNFAPLSGRSLTLLSIEAPIPSFGSGASAYARIDDNGGLSSVKINETGSEYKFSNPPKITVNSTGDSGTGGAAEALINGIKNLQLLSGGKGYSETNPPIVQIESPSLADSVTSSIRATVTDGSVTALELDSSGSGYTFIPRITFKQPGGAEIGPVTIADGSISGPIPIISEGEGYSTPPVIYIDAPTGDNPINPSFTTVITDGKLTGVTINNRGQGYTTTPRIKLIQPTGAQVLESIIDADGRLTTIELLDGGDGYEDVPSVYIIDSGTGTGATAVASIFNGRITDINVTNFGSGYDISNPPIVLIQSPPEAEASCEIGINQITGFSVLQSGRNYKKAQFIGCARASSGITSYDAEGNAVFSANTAASEASVDTEVKCLDALFIKRLLDKYVEQYLPDVPELDYKSIDVRTSIKTIKRFYETKGTEFSISYLFKLLYGETVSVSYPKDQIIKPSAATWSINTILRATLVSGDPRNIQDALISQSADIADVNVQDASALVENYIAINTSNTTIYELVLSEETIQGSFIVPYKTKLAEPLDGETGIITVDSTIGWPERNGEFVIGTTEVVRYKEKSLNQFIECTRNFTGSVGVDPKVWDSATEVTSNFRVYLNQGTLQEVVMDIVGIVDAQRTNLTDSGSYYLPGDKLTVAKLGGSSDESLLTTWLYNVKKLISISGITFGGDNNQSATVTCSNPHGVLVGDQVTIYGANPIIYNGTFEVTSRDSDLIFQYRLPQQALVAPQGNILVSVDLNKGKSTDTAINKNISVYTTNVLNSFFNDNYVYVASTGIPNYNIGPFPGSALLPGNQRKLNRFPKSTTTISTKSLINPGPIGSWVNGVSVWSYKSVLTKTFGPLTSIGILNAGRNYDAASPPNLSITGGGGSGAAASVVVNGSINNISVDTAGSGYTSSPLISIVGGGGSGAAATAIITKGTVSNILITNGGSGYTSQPSITIVGGEGSGATGTASVRGPIKEVNIQSQGSSYTSQPTVTLSSGSGAVAQAIINNGRIISVAIISAGSGYTTAPEVQIQGVGFGAQARAIIDTAGENAGRVTSIELLNRGINYIQGTTIITLVSVGDEAQFDANVFQWTYNLQESTTFDDSQGAVFEGYNNQYGGEYAHLSNPQRLRFILGDNLVSTNGVITEASLESNKDHSPIIGWAFDGTPIYGPYGYQDPTDQSSNIVRISTSYRLKSDLVVSPSNPTPIRTEGSLLSTDPAGTFVEDYEYIFSLGDLDQYNGRFCKTPEFPDGTYCYFVTIDSTEAGNPAYPYIIGPSFNSIVDNLNLSESAIQQNIPTGVVRYRDPYENVDIDVERTPNASTNSLTLEDGTLLLFDVEDENRDGVINQDETDDPDQILEEPPLQIYDYFPKVKTDSKVDIEVETISKFENASVTGFVIENSGVSYQVDDKLIFDNSETGGSGASARVSTIKGESIASYDFEYKTSENYGVVQTSEPHNLIIGDTVFVDYTENIETTNKQFVVRQLKGIETINITQSGSGYNEDIPPTIIIDGDGVSGELEAVVDSVGSVNRVNILNSGNGYTTNPRVILSHPQVFKKSDYYISSIVNEDDVIINDTFVTDSKESYICGKTTDSSGDTIAVISKLSVSGVSEWNKTLKLSSGLAFTEFQSIYVEGKSIWVVGVNKPNTSILDAYNPDIIICKYTESNDGLSATLEWQRAYAGISGGTRSDNVTKILRYGTDSLIISGYTNTNSTNPYDGFIAVVDSAGTFSVKRKLTSNTQNEKVLDIILGSDGQPYFLMETSTSVSEADKDIVFGRAVIGISNIDISWIRKVSNNIYSLLNPSIAIDEFDELYLSATLQLKSNDTNRENFWIGKFRSSDGVGIWSYSYAAPGRDINLVPRTKIDIFGNLNLVYTRVDNTTEKQTVANVKVDYKGKVLNHTINSFTENNVEGIVAETLNIDNSGDVYIAGQTYWNRNEGLFGFDTDLSDTTGHHTMTTLGLNGSIAVDGTGGYLKIYGFQTGQSSTWENSAAKIPGSSLGNNLGGDFTIDFLIYKDDDNGNADTLSADYNTLIAIGDGEDTTGGIWLYYNTDGSANEGRLELVVTDNTTKFSGGTAAVSSQTGLFANDTWQLISLTKTENLFKVYVNGIEVISGTVANTQLGSKDIHFGNAPGFTTSGAFSADKQGQFFLDDIRIRNRYVLPTAPTDFGNPLVLPVADAVALAYTWTDTAWFTEQQDRYDLISYNGFVLKTDKNADAARLGASAAGANTQYGWTRTAVSPVTGNEITMVNVGYSLGDPGLQSLDYSESSTSMTEDSTTVTYFRDIWSSRTATVPSPGSQKLKVEASVADRYYFKTYNTVKIDNIQELTINQPFNFTVGSKLELRTGSTFVNSGYITSVDTTTNKVYLAVNNNSWTDDTNIGNLATVQFNEQSTYGLVGPIPADSNIISYTFPQVVNTTPGTFNIDLSDYDAPSTIGGTDNLDEFAKFKDYADDDYSIRIDEVSGSSAFVVGSVINVSSNDVSYNSAYSTIQITNLTGVTKITLIANLAKILQVTAVANSDTVYVISDSLHYLTAGQQMFVDGNPTRTVGLANYDEYDGSFPVERVISPIEFTYKLPVAAVSSPSDSAATVNFFVKSPVLKMYYGHQYLFDLSHSSLVGGNLSFSKDPLYKLEYSFNSIERVGTPGVTGGGAPTPTVKLKVEENVITNISYYFDPSRTGADSPVIGNSYLDVTFSPYVGTFEITDTSGGTITSGDNVFEFKLINQPEGPANIINTTYTTSSKKAVGSIGDIRIVNSGGFYNKLPIIETIQSTRNIERVSINAPGTEYAVGTYSSVPITGDGEGGLVEIIVSDGTDDEGGVIPGQIQRVSVTSPGKGYTTATIDIESISGILGAGLTGSGAELEVVIPSFGTGASIFTLGTEIGKIKNLKNNNFGFDYPHDYTLRPEISFPINAQLTNTSILDNIAVTDPGSGYTQAPTVVITGGGGSGAIAEATVKNGRLSTIDVKDPGSGYSSEPTVQLKSSFNYTVNQDLGLLQFAFPHGIQNGSEITLDVVDIGDGAELPIASGAVGRLTKTNTYYAIAGAANSLEGDQLKIAITAANAELGDALAFVNPGTGRQQVLTFSFGGAATGNVITSTFLEGELVYQGDTLETATATGYVSTNSGWQVGPRILKIVDYTGNFNLGNSVTGVISKSSGNISDLKIARGVLEVGPITKTTGQFIDDVGKPSEIVQKIQDSYYYQDFSYAVKSSVSISEWKDILIRNVHPASFKVFGELSINEFTTIPNKVTDFELTKSVELANEAIVPNIQNFTLVEPIYEDFNNSEILFRQKRLTSSENILTSIVQRVDDISTLFDGVRTAFPLTVNNGDSVIANANQLMVILNGVVQTPDTSFQIQSDSIVFAEAPQPPASVKYVNVEISQITTVSLEFTSISGIFPLVGNSINGVSSGSRLTVTSVVGNTIFGFFTEGTQFIASELVLGNITGFSALFATQTTVVNNGLFIFGESIKNLTGDTATVEDVNLEKGAETPVAKLRYTVGISTTDFEVIATDSDLNTPAAVASTAFTIGDNYQIGSEIVLVNSVTNNSESTTINVTRAQLGTTSLQHQENSPFYGTNITITDDLILSKTTGTYQSTPGLFDIQLNDVIIASQSGVVARITSTAPYTDPTTLEVVEQVEISEGSTFFGLLFDRIASITYPNVVIDDISRSQVSVVEVGDNVTEFNSKFPENENVNHYVIPYDTASGAFTEGEFIRNYKLEFGNESGDFTDNEDLSVRKLTLTNEFGNGFFTLGQNIRTRDTKAEVLGFNQAQKVVYLGKLGNSLVSGTDAYTVNFNAGAQINTYNKKYGSGSLALSKGTGVHAFVSGTADSISDGSLTYTAATGTTYDPFTGVLLLEIGAHALTTSDTVTITDNTLTFTCASDNNTNNYTYPRATDPASGSARAISAVTATTITVNVGAVPIDEYLDIATASNFGFGTGEFTIECYIKTTTIATGAKVICDFRSAVNDSAAQLVLNGNTIQYNRTNGGITINGATTLLVDTWYHVAVSRTAGVVRLYLDGVQQGTDTADVTNYGTTRPVHIGSDYAGSDNFAGYIDEFRVSNIGRYAAAFTPRNGMFQGDTNTKLLLHFDETQGATSVQDWSGIEDFTKGEFFNNDAIKANTDANGSAVVAGFTGNSHRYLDAATLLEKNAVFVAKETVSLLRSRYPELVVPGTRFTPTGATYDAATGLLSLTVTGNTFTNGGTITPTTASYVPATGVLTITRAGHGVINGDKINIKVGGITFTCATDSNATNHPYPRSTDPVAGKWLTVSNVSANTFDVNVGISSDTSSHTFVSALTDAITVEKDRIKINDNALTFTCAMDGNATNKTYPRVTDPASKDVALPIVSSSSNNLTVNVGPSPLVNFQPSTATYDPATGAFVMTIANHTINAGTDIRLSANAFAFTCTQDGNTLEKTYPRVTDPAYNTSLAVTAVGTSTQDIGSATYDPATGILTVNTSGAHSLSTGNRIQIADNSLTFTCAYDSNATNHTYPRQTDPIRGEWVAVTVVDSDTFTIDIGKSSDTSTHAFVSATTGALIKQTGTVTINVGVSAQADQYAHTFVSAAANAVVTGGNYLHTFVSAVTDSVAADEGINCEDDIQDIVKSIVEDLRNGTNNHIWDAAALYVDRTDLNAIALNHVETEIDETVWAYNKVGDIIPYIVNNVLWSVSGSHGVTQFTDTTLTDSDNTVYAQFTPTGATYDSATGDMVLTIGSHSLTTSDQVSIAAGSLTFTCSSDNNETQHSYPRIDDPFYNKVLAITAVAATTITVNVGISPEGQRYTHVFVSASSNAISKLNYSTGDCADVKTTVDNLLDIVIDTLTNADLASPVDHLGTITRVAPTVEFIGATVDEYLEIPFDGDYVLNSSDTLYTNKIDEASQYRFRDAANLINYNRTAIVDKAAADMISRYPDLSLDMPRNTDGSGSGTERCKQDLGLILDGIAKDIENGGNKNTLTAGKFYLGNNNEIQHVRLQLFQSIYAHERLGFYSKQAITGDLTSDNTTALIIGDWGITNDAGNCANVQSAIDTLTTQLNDLIAPTGADFATAADRLYFNKEYIATEATGLTDAEFTYILNGITYRAFDYPGVGTAGKTKCERDLKLILLSAISDLQTGGTNSTIEAIELYLTANLSIDHIEEQLTSTIYAIERLRGLGISAIENVLYNAGSVVSAGQYAALHTAETAYRDAISVTDIEPVKAKFGELIDIAVKILSPAGIKGRYAAQQILFNKNYYKTELALTIDNEFGTGSWVYNDYVDGIIDNLSHDFVITDVTSGNTQQSRRIAVTKQGVISELQFTSGAGYRTTPTITIPAPVSGGITATATAVLEASGLIDAITIDSAGSGFDMPPVVIMSGSNVSNDGITATLSGGTVNSLTYDGRVFDADDFIGFGSGTEVTDSGSAIGTVGGFKTGVRHIKFGAASGTREATVSDTNTENLDTIRVYVIAGTGSNGAAAPGDDEDLKFQYSTDQGGTWTNAATLIYGGSNGGAQNYTNFSEITPVTVSVPVGAKTEATRFRIIQPTYTDGFLYDHYAVTRLGLVSNSKQFEGVVTLSFENAPSDSGTTTDPTATFSTLRVVENIIITERGRGYVPATPPTVTISGGSPDSAATITNVNVVLDTARFNKGETVTSSGGGTATVLEDVESVIFIGSVTGTLFADGDSLTGSISGTVADINVSGVGSEFDYYTNVGNIQTFADARLITSPIEGEFSTTNLYTNPEAFQVNWTQTRTTFAANTAVAPDGTLTADKLRASTDDASHIASRDYALASSNTFDDGSLTFDNSSNSFDEGSLSEGESQVYTISTFVKKGEYENVRFDVRLDTGTPGVQRLFFDVDLNNGDTGSIFQPQGGLIVKNRELLTVKEIVVNTRSAMTGTYTGVTGSSTGGLGGVFDIVIDHENAPNTAVVTVTDGGSAWIVDSEILIDGVSIGGVSGQDNLRFNVATTEPAGVGVIPYGNGWFRVYSTIEFSFGFSSIRNRILMRGPNNVPTFAGNGSDGIYLWGSKLNKGQFDAYTSVGGEVFYSNSEYNAKRYTLEVLESYLESALDGTLTSPAPQSTFLAFDNATWRAGYDTDPFLRIARENIDFYRQQLDNATYYVGVTQNSGIVVPSKEYGITYVPPGISGGLGRADFFYGLYSDANAEIKRINVNEAKIAKVYKRFRIDGDITDGPFTMGEAVQKQGDATITGTVYQFHEDENYKYLDVEVTAGTWQISDVIVGQANTTTATLSSIEDRLHVIKLVGDFTEDIPFLGYTSGQTAQPTTFLRSEAAVLDNSGGRLTVDTETLVGTFDKTAVVYGGTTDLYIEVQSYQGLDVTIGDRIISGGYVRFGVNSAADFTVGNYVYKYVGGKDASKRAIITGVDTVNNYVYVAPIDGDFTITEQIADFGTGGGGVNYEALATISTKITVEGGASARINNISAVGINKRLFLNEIVGAWTENDYVIAADNYKSVILDLVTSNARVKRASKGFDGVQTTFNLTISNGTAYLPDPAGHMLIFVNGILQPPGAGNAYNAFSDKIQFAEPPDIGSTFTGFYVGKLRQLDNIGFEFDSLRQSFNLKRDEVFYSLTLTEGVRSSTIRPENNIIVSLNGVIQEPGVGFSIVGSRIIFSEIPRVGSTFVAFSYVGSEADVDASEVVPPIEPGDLLSIEGETEDREVAVIESSNSLITFDYLGSVFGQNAEATAVLTNGFIETVSITAPGSGYTSRPIVRVDSISGFNAQIRAIVGIANVEVNSVGSSYKNPNVLVESEVPDDWTAPNLADYGEEIIDPEVLP